MTDKLTPETLAQCFAGEHALVMLPGSMDLYTADAAAHFFADAWEADVAALAAAVADVGRLRKDLKQADDMWDKLQDDWGDRGNRLRKVQGQLERAMALLDEAQRYGVGVPIGSLWDIGVDNLRAEVKP